MQAGFSDETINCIDGDDVSLEQPIFKADLPKKPLILTDKEWTELIPVDKPYGKCKLPATWTETLLSRIKESNPYCCFAFKEHRLHGVNSNCRLAPYFYGKGKCCHPGCDVEVELNIKAGKDENNRRVTVT